jgi:alpha-L-fucosidase
VPKGAFTDTNRAGFTAQDIRFTYKGGVIYAFVMKFPEDGRIRIRCFNNDRHTTLLETPIRKVSILGYPNPVTIDRQREYCDFIIDGSIDTQNPICLKVELL